MAVEGGELLVTVTDEADANLPGVVVSIREGTLHRTSVTNASGKANFLNLPPASYDVEADLVGFKSFRDEGVHVRANEATPLMIALQLAEEG